MKFMHLTAHTVRRVDDPYPIKYAAWVIFNDFNSYDTKKEESE